MDDWFHRDLLGFKVLFCVVSAVVHLESEGLSVFFRADRAHKFLLLLDVLHIFLLNSPMNHPLVLVLVEEGAEDLLAVLARVWDLYGRSWRVGFGRVLRIGNGGNSLLQQFIRNLLLFKRVIDQLWREHRNRMLHLVVEEELLGHRLWRGVEQLLETLVAHLETELEGALHAFD